MGRRKPQSTILGYCDVCLATVQLPCIACAVRAGREVGEGRPILGIDEGTTRMPVLAMPNSFVIALRKLVVRDPHTDTVHDLTDRICHLIEIAATEERARLAGKVRQRARCKTDPVYAARLKSEREQRRRDRAKKK